MISISLDGIDGCGKSSQIKALEKILTDKGYKVLVTKAIGSELHPVTKILRDLCLNIKYEISSHAQQILFAANALILKEEIINNIGKDYDVVLLDRGYFSFHAYAIPIIKDPTWIQLCSDFLAFNRPQDITFLLDIDPKIAYERRKQREPEKFNNGGEDVIEAKGLDYQYQVRNLFLYYASQPNNNIITFDVNNKTEEEVTNDIINHPVFVQLFGKEKNV